MRNEKNVVVFYHRGDLDGVSSGAILNKVFNYQNINLIGVEYGDTIDELKLSEGADVVYVVDFTFEPFNRMIELNKKRNLIWIDHHKSSIEHTKKYQDIEFKGILGDNKMSAAYLAWNYFYPDTDAPFSIKQISTFDTWQHKFNQDILNFYTGVESLTKMDVQSKHWNLLLNDNIDTVQIDNIINDGRMIRQYLKMRDVSYANEHAFETEFEGYRAIVINIGFAGSFKFDSVYDEKKHDIMIGFSRRKNGIWKISIYTTKKEIDCSAICRKYGGGGHPGAAGLEISSTELPFKI